MEENETSRTGQPGAGAGSLSVELEDKMSGMSTPPATRIPETGIEEGERETSRTWQPDTGA